MNSNFHLSLPCKDIEKTKTFYLYILKSAIGRNTNSWIDINLYGNQITFTKSGSFNFEYKNYRLGNQILPSFHFGIIVNVRDFDNLYARLLKLNINISNKTTFMQDSLGEHQSFFVTDPNEYKIEFKCFKNRSNTFKRES